MALGKYLTTAILGGLMWAAQAGAQTPTGTITGRVVDETTQDPVSGAFVNVADKVGLTNDVGRYSITISAGTHTVNVVRFGYADASQTITVVANQTTTVDFVLAPQALALTGLVVTGYGERRASDITGVVKKVETEEFNTGRMVSAEQLIQTKVAGVQVSDNNEPGGGRSLRIRGATSVNASSEPLIVVDGVPLAIGGGLSAGRNPLNFLNPQDIESITVLKDASATAIYGSRGGNGVLIIETKRGGRGPQIEYTGSMSGSTVTSEPKMLNAAQFRAAVQEFAPQNVGEERQPGVRQLPAVLDLHSGRRAVAGTVW